MLEKMGWDRNLGRSCTWNYSLHKKQEWFVQIPMNLLNLKALLVILIFGEANWAVGLSIGTIGYCYLALATQTDELLKLHNIFMNLWRWVFFLNIQPIFSSSWKHCEASVVCQLKEGELYLPFLTAGSPFINQVLIYTQIWVKDRLRNGSRS